MGTRFDVALVARHPELSRRRARAVIERGQVRVDGETVLEPGRRLDPNADIDWNPNRPARTRARCSVPLLYEDAHLVVIDKPAGLLSVPTHASVRDTEDTALRRVVEYAVHRRRRAGPVHRLDRDTSGALAFSLDAATRVALRRLFRAHRVERVYLALVAGVPEAPEGVVDRSVALQYVSGRRRLARPDEPSIPALTRWKLVQPLRGAALVELRLETGRQHQIRLHMAAIGHPVLGDRIYGPAEPGRGAPARQMLHAWRLALVHPVTGRQLQVESPPPKDFEAMLAALRGSR